MFSTLRKNCSFENFSLNGSLRNLEWFFYCIDTKTPFANFTFKIKMYLYFLRFCDLLACRPSGRLAILKHLLCILSVLSGVTLLLCSWDWKTGASVLVATSGESPICVVGRHHTLLGLKMCKGASRPERRPFMS